MKRRRVSGAAHRERFDFPGYTFGPHYGLRTGREYIGYSPSKKSVARVKEKVGDLLAPDLLASSNVSPWNEVKQRLNRILTGWRRISDRGARPRPTRWLMSMSRSGYGTF